MAEGGQNDSSREESPQTPPWMRWSRDLSSLLDDPTGCELFESYLKQEGCSQQLEFFYAVQGLKSSDPDDPKISQMIRTIYRHYIQNKGLLGLSDETKSEIHRNKAAETEFTMDIFNKAQEEIFAHLNDHIYPNFLKSELYLENANAEKDSLPIEGDDEFKQTPLQTINEDQMIGSFKLTKDALLKTQKLRAKKPEATFIKGNPYHASYNSYNPTSRQTSRQDSEIQSLSSDALTEDFDLERRRRYSHRHHPPPPNRDNLPVYPNHITNRPPSHQQMDVKTFASILIKKLEDVQRKRDFEEKFNKKILECQENNLPRLLAAAIKEKLHIQQEGEPDDILDNHLSRIWNDDTPTRSRSPPNARLLPRRVPNILPRGEPRRRDKDQFSYYSTDSGNVHESRSKSLDRLTSESLKSLKKKKSIELDSGISVSILSGASATASLLPPQQPMTSSNPLERVHQWVEQCGSEEKKSPNSSKRFKKQMMHQQQLEESRKKYFRTPAFVYYEDGSDLPYGVHIPGEKTSITLLQFKEHCPKKGSYKYFFKRDTGVDLGIILEEINDDYQVIPLYEGKIIAHLRSN